MKANTLNEYFSNIGKIFPRPLYHLPSTRNSTCVQNYPTLSDLKLEKELLVKSFKKHVREGKACGPDNILAKELKMIG